MASDKANNQVAEVEPYSDQLVAQLAPILESIPWDEDDGGEGIIMRLLEAEHAADLNSTGSLPSLKDLSPAHLLVRRITKRESDIKGKVPIYLMVDAVNLSTGESVKFNTSAGQPFVALAMCHAKGWLPVEIRTAESDKPTRSGYRPLNLTVLAVGEPKD